MPKCSICMASVFSSVHLHLFCESYAAFAFAPISVYICLNFKMSFICYFVFRCISCLISKVTHLVLDSYNKTFFFHFFGIFTLFCSLSDTIFACSITREALQGP